MPCGTTGESATLESPRSIIGSIEVCVEAAAGRVPVIAGCGSNDTRSAIALTCAPRRSAAPTPRCVVPPYYNRPNQEGIYAHFAAIAEAVDMPIVRLQRAVADGDRHPAVETLAQARARSPT